MRVTSNEGYDLIRYFEGFYPRAYTCPGGILTIGYGHTKKVTPDMIIDIPKAVELLEQDALECEQAIERLVKVPINQNQFDALVSFIFNLGQGNFSKSSLLRCINQQNFGDAAVEILKWRRSSGKVLTGLVRRRRAENLMFRGLDWTTFKNYNDPTGNYSEPPFN